MLNDNEKLLVEAIKSMLNDKSELGLAIHPDDEMSKLDWRGYQYLHEQIQHMFEMKAAELTHSNSVMQAFNKVHSYKYLDDKTFVPAFEKEMTATAVPAHERRKALDYMDQIIEELKTEAAWAEKDSGYNPKLDEINEISQPEQPLDFDIIDSDLNKLNMEKFKPGDASAGKMPSKNPLPE